MTEKRLLGDNVERILQKAGADNITRVIEKKTGRDCGCKKRKQFLNKLHKQMQDMRDRVLNQQNENLKRKL